MENQTLRVQNPDTALDLNVFVEELKLNNAPAQEDNRTRNNSLPGITDESSRDDSEEYFHHRFKGE